MKDAKNHTRRAYDLMIAMVSSRKHPRYLNRDFVRWSEGDRSGPRPQQASITNRWTNDETGFDNFVADLGDIPEGLWVVRIDDGKSFMPGNVRLSSSLSVVAKEKNPNAKLNEADVRHILKLVHDKGVHYGKIPLLYPVSKVQAHRICLGKSYRIDGYDYPKTLRKSSATSRA